MKRRGAPEASISFIVPVFNHWQATGDMLASLHASLPDPSAYEVILVDDCSTDGTREWLESWAPPPGWQVQKLFNPHNMGYACSNHAGIAIARGAILGLLNNDLLFAPGWLEPMLAILTDPQRKAGIVGNVQLRVADGAIDHAGVELSLRGQFEHVHVLPDDAPPCLPFEAVTGACMLLRRADFEAAGGFDTRFVNGCEDLDLCFRIRATGKQVYLATGSRIQHHVSLSRGRVSQQNIRNSRHLFDKWRPFIKNWLSRLWRGQLGRAPDALALHFDGVFPDSFLSAPLTASRIVAEHLIRLEESFWARELEEPEPAVTVGHTRTEQGARIPHARQGFLLDTVADITFSSTAAIRSLQVCGLRQGGLADVPVTLEMVLDGGQTLRATLDDSRAFHLGTDHPLLLPGQVHHIRISAGTPAGQDRPVPASALRISHLVINGNQYPPGS